MRSSIGRNSGKVCHRGVPANLFVVCLGVIAASDVDGAMNLATLHQQNVYFIYIREVIVRNLKIMNERDVPFLDLIINIRTTGPMAPL